MSRPPRSAAVLLAAAFAACDAKESPPGAPPAPPASPAVPREPFPGETHLANIRQLTFGGENAEAYWSYAGDRLVFQTTRPPYAADQIFVMGADGSNPRLASTGKGRTTCAWFLPGDERVLYASTHWIADAPPAPPDRSAGYVWGIYRYRLFTARADGTDTKPFGEAPGYNAEATISRQGDLVVFTSSRDGDLDVYTMRVDGSDVKRLTTEVGYDGGAVFSPDGTKIAWRAGRPADDAAKAEFKALLDRGLVRPNRLELFVMDRDGSNPRQVTSNGKANFGPWFHPDGKRLIFSSNVGDPTGRSFDLYLIGLDGQGLERVTWFSKDDHDDFDGFPMFSPDGKRLVWCSNRHNEKPNETNVFVADWVE
jgi:Tol biopolymer transport system component